MLENFITKIDVNEVLNLKNITVDLDQESKKHLILTGKNGSGKTSVLRELKKFLTVVCSGSRYDYFKLVKDLSRYSRGLSHEEKMEDINKNTRILYQRTKKDLERFGGVAIHFVDYSKVRDSFLEGKFILGYFDARRNVSFNIPKTIQKIELQKSYDPSVSVSTHFIQYIVNLKANKSFARDDNDFEEVNKIDAWFLRLEKQLADLFNVPNLALQFDRQNYNFKLVEDGKQPYDFNQLSDGYASILSIVTDIILRMEGGGAESYDVQGVILIDEIETHLHIDLQKKILPFLTRFFPKLQFIVTTHSPFVLSSIENAVVWDLEKNVSATDLSGYSYDSLVESYFDSHKYSRVLEEKVKIFEELFLRKERTEKEEDELFALKRYLKEIPKFYADELAVKLQQIYIQGMDKK